jgi:hypothetical protein
MVNLRNKVCRKGYSTEEVELRARIIVFATTVDSFDGTGLIVNHSYKPYAGYHQVPSIMERNREQKSQEGRRYMF